MTSWPSARSTTTGELPAYVAIWVKPCQTTAASRAIHSSEVLTRPILRNFVAPDSGNNVRVSTESADPLDVRQRLLAATYVCVARFGLAKTTIDDVVKESGVSRATIYRQFPGGRDGLLRETVGWEIGRYFIRLADHVQGADDLAGLLEDGLVYARRTLLEHELLQKILVTEPERLLGLLSTEATKTLPFIG